MTETGTKVILYTTTNCSACDTARADLTAEGVAFEERNVMAKQEFYDEVLKYSISVPVLLRGGNVEVGWKGDMGCPIF
jgi:glutaredoxin-like protein NrdH